MIEENVIKVREKREVNGVYKKVTISSKISVNYIQEDNKNVVAHCSVTDTIL